MVTEEEFDNFFSQFGKIIDCQLMIDKDTGRSVGLDLSPMILLLLLIRFVLINI